MSLRMILAFFLPLVGGIFLLQSLASSPQYLDMYGSLRVGATLSPFKNEQPKRRFFVHFAGLPDGQDCVDEDCGPLASMVTGNGGRVVVHDAKMTEGLGVPRVHDGIQYSYADKLMIITDEDAKVLAIYRDASLNNLGMAVDLVRSKPSGVITKAMARLKAIYRIY